MIYCSHLPSFSFFVLCPPQLLWNTVLREPALLFFARKGKHLILWVRWKQQFIVTQNSLRIALSKESTRLGAFLYLKTEGKPASETPYCFKTRRWTKSSKRSSLQWWSWYITVSTSKFSSICVSEQDALGMSLRDSWHKLQLCFLSSGGCRFVCRLRYSGLSWYYSVALEKCKGLNHDRFLLNSLKFTERNRILTCIMYWMNYALDGCFVVHKSLCIYCR